LINMGKIQSEEEEGKLLIKHLRKDITLDELLKSVAKACRDDYLMCPYVVDIRSLWLRC